MRSPAAAHCSFPMDTKTQAATCRGEIIYRDKFHEVARRKSTSSVCVRNATGTPTVNNGTNPLTTTHNQSKRLQTTTADKFRWCTLWLTADASYGQQNARLYKLVEICGTYFQQNLIRITHCYFFIYNHTTRYSDKLY